MGKFRVFIAQAGAVAAVMLYSLGSDYLTEGVGFHPVLCGAMIVVALAIPYFMEEL